MNCLFPRTIPNPSKFPQSALKIQSAVSCRSYKDIRPYRYDTLQIPCGKCINCLKNKQNYLVSKAYFEARERGSFWFLTLTFDERKLPISETMICVDKESGEVVLDKVYGVQIVRDEVKADLIRREFRDIKPSKDARFIRRLLFEDSRYQYFVQYTPSLDRFLVREWIKMARITYKRKYGKPLEFSYIAVGEMGPNTCRPHNHIALFGLSRPDAMFLESCWHYGFTQLKQVRNESSDYAAASKYIGKYMSKGKFECDSVKNGFAEKPRLCQSIGMCKKIADNVRSHVCCFDMYGEYDLNTFFSSKLKRYLSRVEVESIVKEVPKRLFVQINEKIKVPIPRRAKDIIFRHPVGSQGKTLPTSLWLMVSAYLRDQSTDSDNATFAEFLSRHPDRTYNENVVAFADYQNFYSTHTQEIGEKNLREFYQKSKF